MENTEQDIKNIEAIAGIWTADLLEQVHYETGGNLDSVMEDLTPLANSLLELAKIEYSMNKLDAVNNPDHVDKYSTLKFSNLLQGGGVQVEYDDSVIGFLYALEGLKQE